MKLKILRESLKITQKKLSEISGVNLRQIQKIESGEIKIENISAKNFMALAEALGVNPEELIK